MDASASRRVAAVAAHVRGASSGASERADALRRHLAAGPRVLLEAPKSGEDDDALRPWIEVSQRRIDAFATCTMDEQHIHRADAPGGAVAHGFLTLALLTAATRDATAAHSTWASREINSGIDRCRFLAPVRAGSHVRVRRLAVKSVTPLGGSGDAPTGARVVYDAELECRTDARSPAVSCLIVSWVVRQYA